jgi:gas vesicle protein
MTTHRRRISDVPDPWRAERGGGGTSAGSFLLATALGIGIGLLAAPQPGEKTRQRLRKQISSLSEDLGDRLGEAQELSGRARERVRDRWGELRKRGRAALDDLEERLEDFEREKEEDSGAFGTLLAIAAGVAATYFLTSERAAPARSKVREAAENVRQKASDRWERYQEESRSNGQSSTSATSRSETGGDLYPSEEAPQAS